VVARQAVVDAGRALDSFLALRHALDRVPGVQAAVLHDGEVVTSVAHGVADVDTGRPLTTDHRFRIASHSKTFTATAVAQLAERGRLRLDDPVATWLPHLAAAGVGAATLRELLAHGAGIVRDGWDGDHWQLVRPFPDAARLAAISADDAAVLARNERFKYSNIGFALLGAIVEAASGQPYAEHVRRELLEPLGLAATTPDIDPDAAGDHATGHTGLATGSRRIPIDHVATGAMAAATGFSSTAADVVRWAAAHFLGDSRIISDDTKRMMQRTEWTVAGGAGEYGLGFAIADVGGRRVLGHGGGFPGFITRTWFDPAERWAVAVLTNAIDGPALAYANVAVRLIDLAGHPPPERPPVEAPSRFTGRFATLWGVVDIVSLGERLYAIDPTQPDPLAAPQHLDVVDDDTLRIAEAPGYASPGELVRYGRAADGSPSWVRIGAATARPIAGYAVWIAGRDRIRRDDGEENERRSAR
jgi:CubicO group peptidase (beta-lactamase class C family)